MNKYIITTVMVFTLLFSCNVNKENIIESKLIRMNQIGFYPTSVKQFVFVDKLAKDFEIINEDKDVVFSGEMVDNGVWDKSGEQVLMGDFSSFTKEGTYKVLIDKKYQSFSFEIKKNVYEKPLNAMVKSYYFQRASMPIEKEFGGIYNRKAGHLDNDCKIYGSDKKIDVSGGWYDAGDYGKYVNNAAFSVGQMLLLAEQFPNCISDSDLNIPESGNNRSDLLDELKYELNWLLKMQDNDGGVFFKVTAKNFSDFVMPNAYNLERLVIGKTTMPTLNFAAVMSQASRLFKETDTVWAEKALAASQKAWNWAEKNNAIIYKNPSDVVTGEYGDDVLTDDFYWAAAELFITTKEQKYFDYLVNNEEELTHQLTNSWKYFIRNNAFHSLLEHKGELDSVFSKKLIIDQINLANVILDSISKNPYRIALNRFEWGSNSDVLNQALILCNTHRLTNDAKYLKGAIQITDYIFGKNATGYSFVTGFGSKQAKFPHHRPSGADDIVEPIPGFVIGGPNFDKQDKGELEYTSILPAKSYMDVQESYASNEVCLNWNSPAVYVLGYLEQVKN
ncbi:glycoside hydrolase family 9 protein [Lutibacter sp. TH_r2]|uniref:glycoside hydrolase family 9 protein n=1 Tax=Lutibacter sp. TH_r2 TaxID=3082083 RepID=UPI002953AD25|nr:glycoside hydrolase family 9 protein [Lutibacter sp. TH_r2]MDV7187195.1 glycoside hydrolase family 9 protein [Lutibacter sp. TH_r2]